MSAYALIAGSRVAQVAAAKFDVHPDLIWVDVSAVTPQPEAGWSAKEANGTWTFAAPATSTPTLAQQAQALLDVGLTVTTTGTLALSAVALATNAAAQSKIVAVMTAVNTTGVFPNGASSWYLLKQDGSLLSGLALAQYKALATAILDFVSACDLVIDGAATTLPTAAATVATA